MNIYEQYVAYFEDIARNHTGICHEDNKEAFFRLAIQDANMGADRMRIRKEGAVMELFHPHYRHSHAQKGHQYRHIEGGFNILIHHKDGDDNGQRSAIDTAADIVEDILLLMAAHSRGGHPLFNKAFDYAENAVYRPVTYKRDGNWAGIEVIFNIRQHRPTCIKASAWKNDLLENEFFPLDEINCIV